MQSIKMDATSINKIHINSSTKMSLNDRFTVISSQPLPAPVTAAARRRSFYRDSNRKITSDLGSLRNRRLLAQLARKHKMTTALKLKRRSLRPYGASMAHRRANNGMALKRGSIKALRVAPNGSPIKANSLSNVATMKADLMGRMNARRSGLNLARRLGSMNRGAINSARQSPVRRRLSLGRPGNRLGGRGNSIANNIRSRSRSRSRLVARRVPSNESLPIRSRLGIKPGTVSPRKTAGFVRSSSRGRRRASVNRVAQGRIQKLRASNVPLRRFRGLSRARAGNNTNNRAMGRARGRSVSRVNRPQISGRRLARSQSRSRNIAQKRSASAQRQTNFRRGGGVGSGRGQRRGRSQQRRRNGPSGSQRNGNGQQQERRGRSRSRGRGRQLAGRSPKGELKREVLDKELDNYMATTKTENNMDFLLRN